MIEFKNMIKKHGTVWIAAVLLMGATGCATSNPSSTSSNPGTYATAQGQTAQGQGTANGSSQPAASSQTGSHAAQQQTQPTISKEIFRQIEHGMTYEEVFSLVGGPGTIVAKEGNPGDPLYTVTYQYRSSDSPNTYIKLVFRSGKLLDKEMTND